VPLVTALAGIVTVGDHPRTKWPPETPGTRQGKRYEKSTMNDLSAGHPHNPARYAIRLKGHLASGWAAWFDGMTLTAKSDGTTVLEGPVIDQAALHGLLSKLRDLGLPLVSVTQVNPDPQTPHATPHAEPQGD